MTKAELEKEAEEFTDSKKSFWRQGRTCIDSVKQAYLAGAEPREKRIANLEAQIEKMKCCENCQHWEGREPIPSLAEEGYYCFNDYPFECKRWELAEELKEIKEND